ncbi:MAG: 4Fe-4S binding protein [Chloroflexota bacterium]
MRLEAESSRCTGCKICQMACALRQFGENNPKKTAIFVSSDLMSSGRYHVAVCDQCGDCEEVCPTGALGLTDGVYTIRAEECIYCYLCVDQCSRGAIYAPGAKTVPTKCIACGDCVELCPTSTLSMVD